jgi:hypothetical protein
VVDDRICGVLSVRPEVLLQRYPMSTGVSL